MAKLLKMFGKGVLITVLLPFILVVWCLYSVYCLSTFIVMFFINVIEFFRGKNSNNDLIEDLEARKIVLEKEKADDQTRQMVNVLYQNALAQAAINQQQAPQAPVTPVQPYGIDNLSKPMPEPQNNQEIEQSSKLDETIESSNQNDVNIGENSDEYSDDAENV